MNLAAESLFEGHRLKGIFFLGFGVVEMVLCVCEFKATIHRPPAAATVAVVDGGDINLCIMFCICGMVHEFQARY